MFLRIAILFRKPGVKKKVDWSLGYNLIGMPVSFIEQKGGMGEEVTHAKAISLAKYLTVWPALGERMY